MPGHKCQFVDHIDHFKKPANGHCKDSNAAESSRQLFNSLSVGFFKNQLVSRAKPDFWGDKVSVRSQGLMWLMTQQGRDPSFHYQQIKAKPQTPKTSSQENLDKEDLFTENETISVQITFGSQNSKSKDQRTSAESRRRPLRNDSGFLEIHRQQVWHSNHEGH